MKIHITKQGETIEAVAGKYAVSNQDLIGVNPHINLTSDLVPGLKLKIPDVVRVETNDHIEKFYPNLEYEQKLKEQAVPIGLKPFPTTPHQETTADTSHHTSSHHTPSHHTPSHHTPSQHTSSQHTPSHHTPQYTTPWSHLNEHTASFNTEPQPHHPWNPGHQGMIPYDMRAIIPPLPYYPPYPPYPYPYPYPSFGYGLPLPIPGFGTGYGFGQGWNGGGNFVGGHR